MDGDSATDVTESAVEGTVSVTDCGLNASVVEDAIRADKPTATALPVVWKVCKEWKIPAHFLLQPYKLALETKIKADFVKKIINLENKFCLREES